MKEKLINNFLRISKIPRESGNEEHIANFFVNIAKENNLEYVKDKNNNVLIKKKGNTDSEPIAFHSHLDMVCVKSKDSNHDFKKDGIDVIINGDKVTANNTSLGADQGVGLAIMLTLIEDKETEHPNLEFLFTTEEETTFNGVVAFPFSLVESKSIINLDSDKDDAIFVGAYGDICNEYVFKGKLIENTLPSYKILIEDLPGGNSGNNVELSEKNAITTMAKLLSNKEIYIANINGGTSDNDIATSCEVIISTNLNVNDIFSEVGVKVTETDNKFTFSRQDTDYILKQILQLKCGFISSEKASANLGLISTGNDEVKIYYVIRSMDEKELEEISNNSKKLNNNFIVSEVYRDSVWEVNKDSKLTEKYKEIYHMEYSEYPIESIVPGGNECSAIKNRINEVDIISIGCNMENIHTTEEITYVSSWVKIYNLLLNLIKSI